MNKIDSFTRMRILDSRDTIQIKKPETFSKHALIFIQITLCHASKTKLMQITAYRMSMQDVIKICISLSALMQSFENVWRIISELNVPPSHKYFIEVFSCRTTFCSVECPDRSLLQGRQTSIWTIIAAD